MRGARSPASRAHRASPEQPGSRPTASLTSPRSTASVQVSRWAPARAPTSPRQPAGRRPSRVAPGARPASRRASLPRQRASRRSRERARIPPAWRRPVSWRGARRSRRELFSLRPSRQHPRRTQSMRGAPRRPDALLRQPPQPACASVVPRRRPGTGFSATSLRRPLSPVLRRSLGTVRRVACVAFSYCGAGRPVRESQVGDLAAERATASCGKWAQPQPARPASSGDAGPRIGRPPARWPRRLQSRRRTSSPRSA
jgi:hypothetical protein